MKKFLRLLILVYCKIMLIIFKMCLLILWLPIEVLYAVAYQHKREETEIFNWLTSEIK